MSTSVRKLWVDLNQELAYLSSEAGPAQLFTLIANWLRAKAQIIGDQKMTRWGLNFFLNITVDDYPHELSELAVEDEIAAFQSLEPRDIDTFLMRVRDILWQSIVLISDRTCPRCGEGLETLYDPDLDRPVFSCRFHRWAEMPDRTEWGGGMLVPITRQNLKRFGLLREPN